MFLAWKEIRYAKMKFLLITGIITLITSLVLSISGLANGLSVDNASAIKNMTADIYVVEESDQHQLERSMMTPDDIDAVKGGSPLGLKMVEMIHDGETVNISLFALDSESPFMPDGEESVKLAPYELLADPALKKEGYKPGDTFTYGEKTWIIRGFTEERFSYGHTPVMFTSIETWKDLLGDDLRYQALLFKDHEGEDIPSNLDKASKDDILSNVPGFSAEQGSLKMMVIFLLIISAIVLATFFYVMTLQKLHQYGVLKAIGAKTGILLRALFVQISILSTFGILAGNTLTYGLTQLIPGDVPFEISSGMILLNNGLILAMAWIGSLLSFRSIMNVDPLEAIGGVK
ncbi:ABC transporter permease [Rossellomorea sp. SC111]|uniref:ABC transporter permease n=1 Tax=Rossellomorea sp. SC111 TaxID=2968985 RepID=UPI00215A3192|nr:ABC transporter permease [Rossellomorea sp. SC111]MCR8849808.1 ABC transporter permease [Rossellomorea sp. SC111]